MIALTVVGIHSVLHLNCMFLKSNVSTFVQRSKESAPLGVLQQVMHMGQCASTQYHTSFPVSCCAVLCCVRLQVEEGAAGQGCDCDDARAAAALPGTRLTQGTCHSQ